MLLCGTDDAIGFVGGEVASLLHGQVRQGEESGVPRRIARCKSAEESKSLHVVWFFGRAS